MKWLEKDGFKILTSPYKTDGTVNKDEYEAVIESYGGCMRWSGSAIDGLIFSTQFFPKAHFIYGYNPER